MHAICGAARSPAARVERPRRRCLERTRTQWRGLNLCVMVNRRASWPWWRVPLSLLGVMAELAFCRWWENCAARSWNSGAVEPAVSWQSSEPDVARGELRWTGTGTWAALRRLRTEVLLSTPGPRLWCSFPCGRGVASRTPQIQTLLCCAPLRVSQCVCASVLRKDALSGTCS